MVYVTADLQLQQSSALTHTASVAEQQARQTATEDGSRRQAEPLIDLQGNWLGVAVTAKGHKYRSSCLIVS